MRLSDMTEEKFVAIAMRIVKLFQPIQPSDEEFLAVRLADNAPDDEFIRAMQSREMMNETASQIFELWITRPEGNA